MPVARRLVVGLLVAALLAAPWAGLAQKSPGASSKSLDEPLGATTTRPAAGPHPAHPVDPRVSSGIGRLFVTTPDPLIVPNDGLRTNLTAFAPQAFAPFTSYQEGAEETIGGYDAVFGLFENAQTAPVPFFSVFSNTTDVTVHLAYWTAETLLTGASYDFELGRSNGTNWTLTVNGALFGGNGTEAEYDFGAVTSTWAGGVSFSEIALYTNVTTAPPTAPASLALAVHTATGWYLPTQGLATFSGPSPWGIEGRAQHPTLAPGALVSGTSLAAVVNGTVLWSGGPVGVGVVLVTPPSAVGLTTVPVTARVTDTNGAPLPGVAVTLYDVGGNFTPGSSLTNASGGVYYAWSTPNATANVSDPVTALVTTFGYRGLTTVAVDVSPPLHVVFAFAGSSAVPPGGSASVTVGATDPSGHAVGGVYLSFSATGGLVAPTGGETDASGHVTVGLSTVARTGLVVLVVTAVGSGVWGSASLTLPVRAPASDPWPTYALVAGVVAAAALVAGVLWRRPRRRRPTAEELWGPSLRPERGPVSRTPPGSGGP